MELLSFNVILQASELAFAETVAVMFLELQFRLGSNDSISALRQHCPSPHRRPAHRERQGPSPLPMVGKGQRVSAATGTAARRIDPASRIGGGDPLKAWRQERPRRRLVGRIRRHRTGAIIAWWIVLSATALPVFTTAKRSAIRTKRSKGLTASPSAPPAYSEATAPH